MAKEKKSSDNQTVWERKSKVSKRKNHHNKAKWCMCIRKFRGCFIQCKVAEWAYTLCKIQLDWNRKSAHFGILFTYTCIHCGQQWPTLLLKYVWHCCLLLLFCFSSYFFCFPLPPHHFFISPLVRCSGFHLQNGTSAE